MTITMADQDKTSSTQSLQDSFLSDPNAHHTKPIQPPRSNASRSQAGRSQKQTFKHATLTAEALAALSPKDKNQTAVAKHTRIKEFLYRLPDPEDTCNEPPYPDPTAKLPKQWYQDPTTISHTLHTIRDQLREHNTSFLPSDMHLWHRYQKMLKEEEYAQFCRHKAWLSLQYSEHHGQKVTLFVGVDNFEHRFEIHRQMVWLRDKWLGVEVELSWHVVHYGDNGKILKGITEKMQLGEEYVEIREILWW
jgi:hypothetical protein